MVRMVAMTRPPMMAKAIGPEGYLSRKGLVTLPKEEAEKVRKSVLALETLQASGRTDAGVHAEGGEGAERGGLEEGHAKAMGMKPNLLQPLSIEGGAAPAATAKAASTDVPSSRFMSLLVWP
mgnify:CR=1 FL=1